MSLLDAFRKKESVEPLPEPKIDLEQLTLPKGQMDIKTLDQSLEYIAKQSATIQGLENQLKEKVAALAASKADLGVCIEKFGLAQRETEQGFVWESSKINALLESVKELNAARDALESKLVTAETKIIELESSRRSVEIRAMEFLAAQGGKPLPVSGSGKPQPSGKAQVMEAMDEARRAGDQEAMKRYYAEYQKLKNS